MNLFLVLSIALAFGLLVWSTSRNPAFGLGMLILALPVLGLSRRLFSGPSIIYPSLETIAVIIVLACSKLNRLRKEVEIRRLDKRLTIAIWIFLSTCLLSSIVSDNPTLSLKILLSGAIIPVACFLIAYRHIEEIDDIRFVIYGFFGFAILAALYTVIGYVTRISSGLGGSELYKWLYNEAPVANLLVVSSVTIATLVYAVPTAFWYRAYGSRYRRMLWIIVIIACLITGILSLSRGSWSGLSVAFIASIPLIFKKGKSSRAVLVFIIIAAITLIYFAGFYQTPTEIIQFRLEAPYAEQGVQSRLANYNLAMKSATKYYFWGVGLGQYTMVYKAFPDEPASRSSPLWFAHNLFLTLIPEIGIIGALAFIYIFIHILVVGFKRSFSNPNEGEGSLIYALLIGVISYLVIALTSGAHLIAYLEWNTMSTYFIAPALIVTFTVLGCVAALCARTDTADERRGAH